MRNRKDLSDMGAVHTNVFWSLTRVARGIYDRVMKEKIYHYREDIKYCKLDVMACLNAQCWSREDNLNFFFEPRCLAPIYLSINLWIFHLLYLYCSFTSCHSSHFPHTPSLSPRSPFTFRKCRPPKISITHSATSYNKTNHISSFQGWTTEPSRRKRVPQAGNGVRDTTNICC